MVQLLNIKQACKISNSFIHLLLTCTSTTWMESQHPLIFLDPSPAFLMRITPAKPWSKSQRYTEETPPSKYLNNTDIRCHKRLKLTGYQTLHIRFLLWHLQVSVLIEGIVCLNLEFPQAGWRHCAVFNGRFILITPRGSEEWNIQILDRGIY